MATGNVNKDVLISVRITVRTNERLRRVATEREERIAEFARIAIIERLSRLEHEGTSGRRNGG
jgi:hypothetical protein